MKLLIISQYYPPETGACANRISGFSRYLASSGHDVTVLTGFPNYPKGKLFEGYRQSFWQRHRDGAVELWRSWTPTVFPRSPYHRLFNYCGYFLSSLATAFFKIKKPDIVLATSGPILAGFAGALIAKWFKRPFVLDLRDVWPERIVAAGEFKSRPAIGMLKKIESFIYRSASRIICVSDNMRLKLEKRGIDPAKISVITNGTDLELFCGAKARPVCVDLPENRFVAVYAGTMGFFQDHDLMLKTAEKLSDEPQIQILLIGEGVKKKFLAQEIKRRKLQNIRLLENQTRENLAAILPYCHVGLNANTLIAHNRMAIPVKMIDYMASGLPVLLANEGETERIIQESHAGFCVSPGDVEQFSEKLRYLFLHPEMCRKFGEAGRRYVEEKFSIQRLSRDLEKLLLDLMRESVLSSEPIQK